MSTILKALRRLEQERDAHPAELRDQIIAPAGDREPRPRLPLLFVAGAGGAALVVAAFVWISGRTAPSETAAAPPEPPALAAVVATPAAIVPAPEPRSAAVQPRFAPVPVASRQELAAAPAPRVSAPRAPAPSVAARIATPSVASAPPLAPPEKMPGIVGQPEVARRAPLPRIVVERTLWHPTRDRRLAFLQVEGHEGIVELREGDAVGDAVVQQIDPSAVLFVHKGVEIRRRIGTP